MRFIGNKEKLAPIIYDFLQKLELIKTQKQSFFDVFSGSVSMGKFFRQKVLKYIVVICCIFLMFCKKPI